MSTWGQGQRGENLEGVGKARRGSIDILRVTADLSIRTFRVRKPLEPWRFGRDPVSLLVGKPMWRETA